MSNMARALTYLIAANIQALGLVFVGWWLGEELNKSYPKSFSWFSVTIPVSMLAVFHTYYLVIRQTIKLDKQGRAERERAGDSDKDNP